jgi:hypothetical protein
MPVEPVATTIGYVVLDLILTPASHSSAINALRPVLDQPSNGIYELPMRKYCDVLSRMLCELPQERLNSKHEIQERLGAFTISECGV